jgi:hypothetical protein
MFDFTTSSAGTDYPDGFTKCQDSAGQEKARPALSVGRAEMFREAN